MTAIIIPRRHLIQPRCTVRPSERYSPDWVYAPWMGRQAFFSADGAGVGCNQESMGDVLSWRSGVGTQFSALVPPTVAPKISGFPFSFAVVVDVLVSSGSAMSVSLGISDTNVSSAAFLGFTSDFIGDIRPSYRVGGVQIADSNWWHGKSVHMVGVSESATSHRFYVAGMLVGASVASAVMFEAGAPLLAIHAVRQYNYNSWFGTNTNFAVMGGAWWRRALSHDEALSLSENMWHIFRADPVRFYSLPSGPITLNSLTMSAFTSSGARATLGIAR